MKKELEKVCKKYSNEGGCSKCPYSEKHKNSFGTHTIHVRENKLVQNLNTR